LSRDEAELTLVAAVETARGVTVAARPVADPVRAGALRAGLAVRLVAVVVVVDGFAAEDLDAADFAAAGLAAGDFAAAGLAVLVDFLAVAGRVTRAADPARPELAIRTGAALAVAFFVGDTDLPPNWIS
jgi:hypothetical protein